MKKTIEAVMDEFLTERKEQLSPQEWNDYRDTLDLLKSHLNGYAYENLSSQERQFFEKHYNAPGEASRRFCQLFGPEKIPENLRMFLDYFLVRKVMAGPGFSEKAGKISSEFMSWLGEHGYISNREAEEGSEEGRIASRNLARAEKAASILYRDCRTSRIDAKRIADEDYREFDHFTISRLEPGKIWFLNNYPGGPEDLGPVRAPEAAVKLLEEDWDISCTLARIKGEWRLIEMGNIYPL